MVINPLQKSMAYGRIIVLERKKIRIRYTKNTQLNFFAYAYFWNSPYPDFIFSLVLAARIWTNL